MNPQDQAAYLALAAELDDIMSEFPVQCWPPAEKTGDIKEWKFQLKKANTTIARCRRAWEDWRGALDPDFRKGQA